MSIKITDVRLNESYKSKSVPQKKEVLAKIVVAGDSGSKEYNLRFRHNLSDKTKEDIEAILLKELSNLNLASTEALKDQKFRAKPLTSESASNPEVRNERKEKGYQKLGNKDESLKIAGHNVTNVFTALLGDDTRPASSASSDSTDSPRSSLSEETTPRTTPPPSESPRANLHELEHELRTLQKRNEEALEAKDKFYKEGIQKLLERIQIEREEYQRTIDGQKNEIDHLKEQIGGKQAEAQRLQDDRNFVANTSQLERQEFEKAAGDLQSEITRLNDQLQQKQAEAHALRDERKKIESNADNERKEFGIAAAGLNNEISLLKEQIQEKEKEAQRLQNERKEYQRTIDGQKNEIDHLKEQIEERKAEAQRLQDERNDVANTSQLERQEFEKAADILQSEITRLNDQLQQKQAEAHALQDERRKIESSAHDERKEFEKASGDLRTEIAQLKEQMQQKVQSFQDERKKLHESLVTKQKEFEQLAQKTVQERQADEKSTGVLRETVTKLEKELLEFSELLKLDGERIKHLTAALDNAHLEMKNMSEEFQKILETTPQDTEIEDKRIEAENEEKKLQELKKETEEKEAFLQHLIDQEKQANHILSKELERAKDSFIQAEALLEQTKDAAKRDLQSLQEKLERSVQLTDEAIALAESLLNKRQSPKITRSEVPLPSRSEAVHVSPLSSKGNQDLTQELKEFAKIQEELKDAKEKLEQEKIARLEREAALKKAELDKRFEKIENDIKRRFNREIKSIDTLVSQGNFKGLKERRRTSFGNFLQIAEFQKFTLQRKAFQKLLESNGKNNREIIDGLVGGVKERNTSLIDFFDQVEKTHGSPTEENKSLLKVRLKELKDSIGLS